MGLGAPIVVPLLTSRGRYELDGNGKLELVANVNFTLQCPDKPNITNSVVCTTCGGAGHIARDCRQKMSREEMGQSAGGDRAKIDEEVIIIISPLHHFYCEP
jgi:splicing factor 1